MHQKKAKINYKIIIFFGVVLLILIGAIIFNYYHKQTLMPVVSPSPKASLIADASFSCDDNKTIQADFYPNQVMLRLSDGRNLTVPQAISADGARYANSDESFVFWNKGNTAFVQEGQATSYSDCVQDAMLAPTKGDISMRGEIVCLPHKKQSGPQTMECAYGLKSDQGQYYALSDKDPQYKNISKAPMNKSVEVTGSISLSSDSNYDTIGTIFVSSIK